MDLIIALLLAVVFSLVFRNAIHKAPVLFYVIAIAVDLIFLFHALDAVSTQVNRAVQPYFFKGLFAYGLFAVVMFIGVFSHSSSIRKYLQPIRGELSIIAAILIYGHAINYLGSYMSQFTAGFFGMRVNLILSFLVSAVLLVLLTMLTITSFEFVRKRMHTATWKKVQRWAYPFFFLIYVHLLFVLGPATAAAAGWGGVVLRVSVYSVVTLAYIVFRVRRAVIDRQTQMQTAASLEVGDELATE